MINFKIRTLFGIGRRGGIEALKRADGDLQISFSSEMSFSNNSPFGSQMISAFVLCREG
jgi:hypothetical protein